MTSAQSPESIVYRAGSVRDVLRDNQYSHQTEENPLDHFSRRLSAHAPAHPHDEPPPPYEMADIAPQIAAIEYSCENSPQLVESPYTDLPEVVPPPRNPARIQLPPSPMLSPVSSTSTSNSALYPPPLQPRSRSRQQTQTLAGTASQAPAPATATAGTPTGTIRASKAAEAGFTLPPHPSARASSTSSITTNTTTAATTASAPLVHSRAPGQLTAYLIPLPKPRLKGVNPADIPTRFVIYTPPAAPLSKPAPGEKESHWHKTQRKWQEDVRRATIGNASAATWKGVKAKATRAIGKGVAMTKTTNLEFLDRVTDGAIWEAAPVASTTTTTTTSSSSSSNGGSGSGNGGSGIVYGSNSAPVSPSRTSTTSHHSAGRPSLTLEPPPRSPARLSIGSRPSASPGSSASSSPISSPHLRPSFSSRPDSSAGPSASPNPNPNTNPSLSSSTSPFTPSSPGPVPRPSLSASRTSTSTSRTPNSTVPTTLHLLYPPSLPLTPAQIRTEFTASLLRTRARSQRDAVLASSLLPLAAAVDVSLVLTFGGLMEVSAVWAHSSIKGARTSRRVARGLEAGLVREGQGQGQQPPAAGGGEGEAEAEAEAEAGVEVRGCTCGHHTDAFGAATAVRRAKDKAKEHERQRCKSAKDTPPIALHLTQSPRLEPLRAYLEMQCLRRDFALFPQLDGMRGDVTEAAALEAIGWRAVGRAEWELEVEDSKGRVERLSRAQDEAWQVREAKEDLRRLMKKGAAEWVAWCKAFQKDPEAARKK